jgi:hypothetical protein
MATPPERQKILQLLKILGLVGPRSNEINMLNYVGQVAMLNGEGGGGVQI